MTKSIRVENADTSSWPVQVQVQQKNAEGQWVDAGPPVRIDYPTSMATLGIHSHQRLVVEERAAPAQPAA